MTEGDVVHRIAVLPGDGVGPEIIEQGLRVLDVVAAIDDFAYELTWFPHGGEHYLATGELISDETIDEIGAHEALFQGAYGDPRVPEGLIERQVSMKLNLRLDLGVNLRPGKLYAPHLSPLRLAEGTEIDIALVRDTSEDCFVAPGGIVRPDTDDEVSIGLLVYTRKAVERTARHAFSLARRRSGKLLLVTQANAVPAHGIWTRTTDVVSKEFPDVEVRRLYADSGTMALVSEPQNLDVVLTTAWIGGIMADVLGAIVGGIGLIGSVRANPDTGFAMFESAHGSAPMHTGQDRVSPMATLAALALMLDHLGHPRSAARVQDAIAAAFRTGRVPSANTRSSVGTTAATDVVIDEIRQAAVAPPSTATA
jgi:3-isopropylmalate dehydrogenase